MALVEFLLLGPVEVRDGRRRVPMGGPQAEKALAALLLAGGRVVGLDAFTEILWDGAPPATATHQVHKLIARLRQRIPASIDTDGRGYRIRLERHTLDVELFAELAAATEIPELVAALALWRGPALSAVDSRVLRAAAAALDDQRLAAVERLTELRLSAGEAPALAAELPTVVAEHPLRETLRRQLITALHRTGRHAEALGVYAETRALLAEELDPARRPGQRPPDADPGPPSLLPADVPDFTGRGAELDRLLRAERTVVITAAGGLAGIGTTALAVYAAHRLADRFPDGRLFCALHANTPGTPPPTPAEALERLLRMVGVPPETIPADPDERAARWRAELAGRRVLVVLDDAESAAQVRPLLPDGPGCLALVTSRRPLDGLTAHPLDVLTPVEALDLLGAVAGRRHVTADPVAATAVARLCARLPLAIRIAAARLADRPSWTVAELADRLAAATDELASAERPGPTRPARPAEAAERPGPAGAAGAAGAAESAVRADPGVGPAFAVAYGDLTAAQQRMFGLLGLHPGAEVDPWSAAALAQTSVREAEAALAALAGAQLLQSPRPGRYTFHDLLRGYARSLAPDPAEPRRRLHDYYLAAATQATDLIARETRRFDPQPGTKPRHLPPMRDLDAALAWLTAEHDTLLAVAAATEDWQLAAVLRSYFELRGHFADWRVTHEHALPGAGPQGTALLCFNLGALSLWTDRPAEGMTYLRRALGTGDRQLEATALTGLGLLAHLLHRDLEAADHLHRALAIDHDNGRTRAYGWNTLALTEARLGRADAALAHHRLALALARRLPSDSAVRTVLLGLGETSLRLGRPAAEPFRQALELARAARFRIHEALALDGLAHATGDPAYWREALALFAGLGLGQADLVRRHLEDPDGQWCDLCPAGAPDRVPG